MGIKKQHLRLIKAILKMKQNLKSLQENNFYMPKKIQMTNKNLRKKYWLLTGKEHIFLINKGLGRLLKKKKTFKKEIKS